MDIKFKYCKEEVREMKDSGGIPEGSPEELQAETDMVFRLDLRAVANKADEDPMWSSSSALPSDWFFAE